MPNHKTIGYLSWGVALVALMVSLFFSEVMKLPPCPLCWYQRIFMYPLVIIIPIGILKNDQNILIYTFALSFCGLLISGYHSLIYYSLIPETLKLCNAELSCKTKQFELFGFVGIPLMSFFSFLIICMSNFLGVQNVKRS